MMQLYKFSPLLSGVRLLKVKTHLSYRPILLSCASSCSSPTKFYLPKQPKIEIRHLSSSTYSNQIKNRPDADVRSTSTTEQIVKQTKEIAEKWNVRSLFKKYGIPFAIYYSSLYFGGMIGVYMVIESGVFGADVMDLIKMSPIPDYIDINKIDPKYGNIGGAVLINECIEIIRLPFAIFTVPYVKRAWDNARNKNKKTE